MTKDDDGYAGQLAEMIDGMVQLGVFTEDQRALALRILTEPDTLAEIERLTV